MSYGMVDLIQCSNNMVAVVAETSCAGCLLYHLGFSYFLPSSIDFAFFYMQMVSDTLSSKEACLSLFMSTEILLNDLL